MGKTLAQLLFWGAVVVFVIYAVFHDGVLSPDPNRAPEPTAAERRQEANIKEFRAQLDLFHRGEDRDHQAMAEMLADCVDNLIRTGTDREDAFQMILHVVQEPSIEPALACQMANLARDIAAAKRGELTGRR